MRIANRTLRTRAYWARRLLQTPTTFTNWPEVLKGMALGRAGKGPDTLTFRTRSGMHIDTPNRPGARVPVYEVFADDTYRMEWFLGPLLRRPITVVDIGGHVGTFTCRLTQLHRDATVTAFEPSATTSDYLRRNVTNNGVADRVTVVQAALTAESGTAIFDDNGAGSGLNGLMSAREVGTGVATEVDAVSFADAVGKAGGPEGKVDVIKIDCEGGEYDLVLTSKPDSWQDVQRVVIEHHPVTGHSWSELRDFFAGVGLVVQDEDFAGEHGCVWLSRDPLPAVRS